MNLPKYHELYVPFLSVISDECLHPLREVKQAIAECLQLEDTENFIVLTKISHKTRFFCLDSEWKLSLYALLQSPLQSPAPNHNGRYGLWQNPFDKNVQITVLFAVRESVLPRWIHAAPHIVSLFLKQPQLFRSAHCGESHCPTKSKPIV